MNELVSGGVNIALAIVGVAILAVLVSRNANTAGVLTAGGGAFSNSLLAAEAPVLGNSFGFGSSLGNNVTGPGYL